MWCEAGGRLPAFAATRIARAASARSRRILDGGGCRPSQGRAFGKRRPLIVDLSIPKMLRPYFLSALSSSPSSPAPATSSWPPLSMTRTSASAWSRPYRHSLTTWLGIPHLHSVVSRGVWLAGGQWIPVPYIDTHAAEFLLREKVFRLLQEHDLLSDERIKILRSWRRSTLASIMISTFIPPIPKPLQPFLAISSAAPSPFKDSITTRRATTPDE